MGALANGSGKKGAVVAIESARRRLRSRKPAVSPTPPPSRNSKLVFAVGLAVALMAVAIGLRVGLSHVLDGDYTLALVSSLWIVLPGMLPLAIILISRRWGSRLKATPPPILSLGKLRRKRMRR